MRSITLTAALVLATAFTLSCTSNVEMPPPPEEPKGTSSGSAKQNDVFCKVSGACVEVPADMCLAAGGTEATSCEASGAKQSSSSSGQADVYCKVGSTCSLVPKATCSVLQGTEAASCGTSSSSGGTGGSTVSSSSRQTSSNVFTDARNGKVYEYEIAPNGSVWMSENLNYSRDGTIGYCYGTGTDLGEVGANTSGCDSPYGRTYTYAEASASELCPSGWHLPSAAEWQAIGAGATVGVMSSSFYVLAGNFNTNGAYPPLGWKGRGSNGFYWTSGASNYFVWSGATELDVQTTANSQGVTDYFSVRCVRDNGSCGGVPYDIALQFCKDNSVYGKCGGSVTYTPGVEMCCGSNIFTTATQFCYDNSVYAKCGGSITYTPGIEFCSGTKVYGKCGGEIYNPLTQECTGGVVTGEPPAHKITCNGNLSSCTGGGAYGSVDVKNGECIDVEINWNVHYNPDIVMQCSDFPGVTVTSIMIGPNMSGLNPANKTGNEYIIIPNIKAGATQILVCVSSTGNVRCDMFHH
jgi:uncharacterized protein (TIGR02145 family)